MRHINLLLLLLCTGILQAQTQNVQSLLQLETDCPLEKIADRNEEEIGEEELVFMEEEVMVDAVPPPPPPPPPGAAVTKPVPPPPAEIDFASVADKLAKHAKKSKLKNEHKTEEYTLFLNDKMLWGVKNKKGKVTVEPQFDYVKITPAADKFIAAQDGISAYNIYDPQGKKLLAEDYNIINWYANGQPITVTKNGKSGLVDTTMQLLVPAEYDFVSKLGEDYFKVKNDEKFGLLSRTGEEVLPVKYRKLYQVATDDGKVRFLAQSNSNHVMLIDEKGREKVYGIPFYEYSYGGHLEGGRYLLYNGKIIDLQKEIYLFCGDALKRKPIQKSNAVPGLYYIDSYPEAYYFNVNGEIYEDLTGNSRLTFYADRAAVRVPTDEKDARNRTVYKYGVKDTKLAWTVSPEYLGLSPFQATGLFLAMDDNKYVGVIDGDGKAVIPFEYTSITRVGDEYVVHREGYPETFEILNLKGEKKYTGTGSYKRINSGEKMHTAYLRADNKRVILDENYKLIYDERFSNAGMFGEEAIWLEIFTGGQNKEYKMIDLQGKPYAVKIDGKPHGDYKKIKRVHDTPFFFFAFKDGGKYIYNTETEKGYAVDENVGYVSAGGLYKSAGLLKTAVKYREDEGLIDLYGNEILPPAADGIYGLGATRGALLSVTHNGKAKTFGLDGRTLFADYDGAKPLFDSYYAVEQDGKFGVMTLQGKEIIPFQHTKIYQRSAGGFIAEDAAGKKTEYDVKGRRIGE